MVVKTITRKKTHNTVKEEFLNLLRENDIVEEPGLTIANMINLREAITIINHYEEIIKKENKKTIGYVVIQGQMLKKFRDTEDFIENVGLSRSAIYFKIGLYKTFKEFPALKKTLH